MLQDRIDSQFEFRNVATIFFPPSPPNAGVGSRSITRKILGKKGNCYFIRFDLCGLSGIFIGSVIIGRERELGRFSSRLVESPGAEWVGELKNRYVRK